MRMMATTTMTIKLMMKMMLMMTMMVMMTAMMMAMMVLMMTIVMMTMTMQMGHDYHFHLSAVQRLALCQITRGQYPMPDRTQSNSYSWPLQQVPKSR